MNVIWYTLDETNLCWTDRLRKGKDGLSLSAGHDHEIWVITQAIHGRYLQASSRGSVDCVEQYIAQLFENILF